MKIEVKCYFIYSQVNSAREKKMDEKSLFSFVKQIKLNDVGIKNKFVIIEIKIRLNNCLLIEIVSTKRWNKKFNL